MDVLKLQVTSDKIAFDVRNLRLNSLQKYLHKILDKPWQYDLKSVEVKDNNVVEFSLQYNG